MSEDKLDALRNNFKKFAQQTEVSEADKVTGSVWTVPTNDNLKISFEQRRKVQKREKAFTQLIKEETVPIMGCPIEDLKAKLLPNYDPAKSQTRRRSSAAGAVDSLRRASAAKNVVNMESLVDTLSVQPRQSVSKEPPPDEPALVESTPITKKTRASVVLQASQNSPAPPLKIDDPVKEGDEESLASGLDDDDDDDDDDEVDPRLREAGWEPVWNTRQEADEKTASKSRFATRLEELKNDNLAVFSCGNRARNKKQIANSSDCFGTTLDNITNDMGGIVLTGLGGNGDFGDFTLSHAEFNPFAYYENPFILDQVRESMDQGETSPRKFLEQYKKNVLSIRTKKVVEVQKADVAVMGLGDTIINDAEIEDVPYDGNPLPFFRGIPIEVMRSGILWPIGSDEGELQLDDEDSQEMNEARKLIEITALQRKSELAHGSPGLTANEVENASAMFDKVALSLEIG